MSSLVMHPALAGRVVYPLHERLMKRPTFAYLESLERSQWLTRAEVERLQMDKLKALLRTAVAAQPLACRTHPGGRSRRFRSRMWRLRSMTCAASRR